MLNRENPRKISDEEKIREPVPSVIKKMADRESQLTQFNQASFKKIKDQSLHAMWETFLIYREKRERVVPNVDS
jgi:hypothetical protein